MGLRPHDLLRLNRPEIEAVDRPGWVAEALARAPWVVVRRNVELHGMIAVGVRGSTRAERFAALLDPAAVAERVAPEDLAPRGRLGRKPLRGHPSFDAMTRLAPALDATGKAWGPGGAAGFELASGARTLTDASDLDIVIRADGPLDRALLRALADAAALAPVRVDVVIETPAGGVALGELTGASGEILLRTREGPKLVAREAILSAGVPA